jgi:hypothetical protein
MVRGVIDMSGVSDAEAAFRQNEIIEFRAKNPDRFAQPANQAAVPNITVNMGIVGDPESAARAVINLLNQSQARGTLGAGLLTP